MRELEAETRKLQALMSLKDEQLELASKTQTEPVAETESPTQLSKSIFELSASNQLNSSNLSLLNEVNKQEVPLHGESCNCGCVNYPHSVHERPTSIAGSVLDATDEDQDDASLLSFDRRNLVTDDRNPRLNFFDDTKRQFDNLRNNNDFCNHFNVSFEQKDAPGTQAALTIASMKNDKTQLKNNIAVLVAMSTPRTTEETLFIPSLIAKIGSTHGYTSKPAVLTAKSLALLKFPFASHEDIDSHIFNLKNINFNKITKAESFLFFTTLRFPPRLDLDQLITFFFQHWSPVCPIVDQLQFLKSYIQLTTSSENKYEDNAMYQNEKFGAILLLVVTIAMLGKKNSNKYYDGVPNETVDNKWNHLFHYYSQLIKQLIDSSIVALCSMQSLQILTLALLYSLHVCDTESVYTLRGKVITMAQQLRLHRCPSAVLGNKGTTVSKIQQSERRILFWCIYSLDAFCSLQLGVPRLIKDYEIECALPFANDDLADDHNTNILIVNNSKLSLVGKVSNFSLSVMRYSKIMGNILDAIFRRGGITSDSLAKSCIILENLLESWRKELPANLKFDLDSLKNNDYRPFNNKVLTLITLYYQAKLLIYLPALATELYSSRGSSSYIAIHQASHTILSITNYISHQNYLLPIPLNPSRMRARYSLLGAKSALEYARGGHLFQELKVTLVSLINDLKLETKIEAPGCLTVACTKTLEEAILAILAPPASPQFGKKKRPATKPARSNSIPSNPVRSVSMEQQNSSSSQTSNVSKPSPLSKQERESSPNELELDMSLFSEFAADGSLGLAQLLDIPIDVPLDPSIYDPEMAAQIASQGIQNNYVFVNNDNHPIPPDSFANFENVYLKTEPADGVWPATNELGFQ